MKTWLTLLITLILCSCDISTFESPHNALSSIIIQWDQPVERENGEQLHAYEIGGYEINYRMVGDNKFETVMVEDGHILQTQLSGLRRGTYEVKIACFDSNGLYSQFSPISILTIE